MLVSSTRTRASSSFMACPVVIEPELLPPRELPPARSDESLPDEPNERDPGGE